MAEQLLPTLSTSGYVASIYEKADRLMAYYLVSQKSQTTLYANDISSFPERIQSYSEDLDILRENVKRDLERLYGSYFDTTEVEVITDIPNPNDPNRVNLTIKVVVITEDGLKYSLARLLETQNGLTRKIFDINNGNREL